jgi:uncharacterized membrane protein YidH (DUF202 family)
MQGNKMLGILLVLFGAIGLAYGSFRYTSRDKVIDLGPIQATAERSHEFPMTPVAGAMVLAGGIVLLLALRKP